MLLADKIRGYSLEETVISGQRAASVVTRDKNMKNG